MRIGNAVLKNAVKNYIFEKFENGAI